MIIEKIKKIPCETTQKLLLFGFIALILYLPVPQFQYHRNEVAISMQASIISFAAVYFGIILAIEALNKRVSFRMFGITWKCMAGLTIIGIISVLFSEEKAISLYGSWIRMEGLITLVSYYVIFMATTMLYNEKYRRVLLYVFLGLGCIVAVYGVIQFAGVIGLNSDFPYMAYIPMRNPNFYGAFSVLFTGVAIGGYFIYSNESKVTHPFFWWVRPVWYVLVLFGYIACISAASSVTYVGLIMMFLLYFYLEILNRKKFLPLICLVLGLVAVMFIMNWIGNGSVFSELFSVGKQIEMEGSLFGDGVGSGRMQIWKQTLSILPRFWLFGCGIELLEYHWYEGYLGYNCLVFDKAHNEYLNLWVTEGIFALVVYLVFLFALFIPGVAMFRKTKKVKATKYIESEVSKIALFAFFGYIAQAFFNISVVQVAPYFWMMCGLLYCRKRKLNEETMDS